MTIVKENVPDKQTNEQTNSNFINIDIHLDNSFHAASFFSINTLNSFSSNNDLQSLQKNSLQLEPDKSFKGHSKRKYLFRVNSVDDAIFK